MKKALILLPILFLLTACGPDFNTPDIQPTPTPTIHWQTVTTFSGQGTHTVSPTFTVGSTWKIQWSCDPNSNKDGIYSLIIYKHKVPWNGDNSIPYADVNTGCNNGNTSGETVENTPGNFYLEVNTEVNGGGSWNVAIQTPS